MQPTLPPRLHIKLQSSTDTTLDQAPELSTLPEYCSYCVFAAKNVLYFVYLILIFVYLILIIFLNYFYFNFVL